MLITHAKYSCILLKISKITLTTHLSDEPYKREIGTEKTALLRG